MTKGSQIPMVAKGYFGREGNSAQDINPVIVSEFTPGLGWAARVSPAPITLDLARKLRREGVTYVALANGGVRLDFSVEELLVA